MTTKVITKVRIAKKSNNNAATQATAKVRITKKKKTSNNNTGTQTTIMIETVSNRKYQ